MSAAFGVRSLRGASACGRSRQAVEECVRSLAGLRGSSYGFTRREIGLEWFRTKHDLLTSSPGPVLVGSSFEYQRGEHMAQARKYSSFNNHEEYWDCVTEQDDEGLLHNLHEVFEASAPRCLYFDLDGPPSYKEAHHEIIKLLREFVMWFFDGEAQGWKPEALEPVVLTSNDPSKYSAHVVFPEVQFKNYSHQSEYMRVMLSALPALRAELPDGRSMALLADLVDCAPYSQFQLLRGPYACKLKDGILDPETRLEPEGYFRSDPLAYFAGYVEPEYALPLPPLETLLTRNERLRYYREQYVAGLSRASGSRAGRCSFQDEANLYQPLFAMGESSDAIGASGVVDLSRACDVEKFEVALSLLHPHRATQWWSWFRLSGVTYCMLQRHAGNVEATRRIWDAHFNWSRGYEFFDQDENVDMVMSCDGRPVSGLNLLMKLARFDNPLVNVVEKVQTMVVPRSVTTATPIELTGC